MISGGPRRADVTNTPMHFFLVDDEPIVLRSLSQTLTQMGHGCRSFSRPADALDALAAEAPECVLTDFYMPGCDGVKFLEEVRSRTPSAARVLITGGHVGQRLRDALDGGTAQLLLLKPCHPRTILRMIDLIRSGDSGVMICGESQGKHEVTSARDARESGDPAERRSSVLVVVGDPDGLSAFERILGKLGYGSHGLKDPRDAVDRLKDCPFDAVLMDLNLPDSSGIEAIGLIREEHPLLPIFALTDRPDKDAAVAALLNGATGLLRKPLDIPQMEDALRRSIRFGRFLDATPSQPGLGALLEIQHAIASGRPMRELLDMLMQQVIRFTGADSARVLLLDRDDKTLRVEACCGMDDEIQHKRPLFGKQVSEWVAKNDQPQVVMGYADCDPCPAGAVGERAPMVGLFVPMRGRDSLVGVLCLIRRTSQEWYSRDSIDLALLLSSEVARALERLMEAGRQADIERSVMQRDKLVTIGELTSGIAHDINNPLGYVNSNLGTLASYFEEIAPILECLAGAGEERDLNRAAQLAGQADLEFILQDLPQCIKETLGGIERVLNVVNDLKNFSRDDLESREEANINKMLDGAANVLRGQIKSTARLVRDYGELPDILCYPSQLGQVFLNLLYNATQAIEREGQIVLRTRVENDQVIVELSDTGCGMAPDVQSRIFDTFFTTKPRGVGTGLGLSIAKKIIERHGGRIGVTSTVGRGSTFRVSLPTAAGELG